MTDKNIIKLLTLIATLNMSTTAMLMLMFGRAETNGLIKMIIAVVILIFVFYTHKAIAKATITRRKR